MNGNLFSAIRGPVMMITLGSLFALDHMQVVGFDRTWPLLIIVLGLMKLLERLNRQPVQPQYPPDAPYTGQMPGGGI